MLSVCMFACARVCSRGGWRKHTACEWCVVSGMFYQALVKVTIIVSFVLSMCALREFSLCARGHDT